MRSMSIKEYAVANKLSIYNVVKMAKNGTLQTETKNVDGKDEIFIKVTEDPAPQSTPTQSEDEEKIEDYKKAYIRLKIQYDQLKTKYENLQKRVDTGK